MAEKKEVKQGVSVRMNRKVWDNAKLLGNRSKLVQQYLEELTKSSTPLIMENITYCRLCRNKKILQHMFLFVAEERGFETKNEKGETLCQWYFVCRDCSQKLFEGNVSPAWDKEDTKYCLSCVKSEKKYLEENKDPEFQQKILNSKSTDIPIRENFPFENTIRVYDGEGLASEDAREIDIKHLLSELKNNPLWSWEAEKGKLTCPCKHYLDDWEENL